MLEPHIVKYTHAYFPVGLFDEVNLDYLNEGYIFGRKNNTYVSMIVKSNGEAELQFKNDMDGVTASDIEYDMSKIKTDVADLIENTSDYRYDLIYKGGDEHAWITELSSVEQDTSFDSFVNRILDNEYTFNNDLVTYTSNNKEYKVQYDSYFKINDVDVDMEYERFESAYIKDNKTLRKSDVIEFSFNGKSLTLNYKDLKRVM